MKKIKVLSALTACVLTVVSAMPIVSGALVEQYCNTGSLDTFLSSYNKETSYITEMSSGHNKRVVVVTEDEVSCYSSSTSEFIKVKKGTELPLDQLDPLFASWLEKVDDTTYLITGIFTDDTKEEMFNIMKQSDNVVSIDKGDTVSRHAGCGISQFYIETDLSVEEFENRYPCLTVNDSWLDSSPYEGNDKVHFFESNGEKYNTYDLIRNFKSDEDIISFDPVIFITADIPKPFYVNTDYVTENIYTAPISGDVNADGVVDIADVVGVSAYVANPESNPINVEQRRINGDVHNSGDGLTTSDVLMIQQYLARIIDTL